jgi:hypothetical protein
MVKGTPLARSPIGWSGTTGKTQPKEVRFEKSKHDVSPRSIMAAAVTAALACGLATGAEIRSSSAAQLTYPHRNGKLISTATES